VGLPTGPVGGPFPELPVPEGLNWDFYVGQAPMMPYNGKNCHWDFRWWYAFSGGQMTDWGAHHNDIAQWGNGTERSGPVEIHGKSLKEMVPGGFTAAGQVVKYSNTATVHVNNAAAFRPLRPALASVARLAALPANGELRPSIAR
jgi:hypothetical protein